jgi:hypothetical protein
VFRSKKWTYTRSPGDAAMNNEELADAIDTRNGVAIVIECKGTFIRSGDKYSGAPRRFMRGLTQKFGNVKHGGVHQLVRAISRICFERTADAAIGRIDLVTDVYPVLVV